MLKNNMINTLIGTKKNMTSTYDARGRRTGATWLSIPSNFVTQIKSKEKDGYEAVQLGMGTKKSVKKPQIGHAKKAGVDQKLRWFREIRTEEKLQLGQEVKVNQVFSVGDSVKVTGTSKGKGFLGGVGRYGFHGGPKTHGQSDRHRAPGSIGAGTTPGRVYKGKRMAGHTGVDAVSIKGLEVIKIDKEKNEILIKGGIPGFTGALVEITKLGKIKGYTPPPEEKEVQNDSENSDTPENQNISETDNRKSETTDLSDQSGTPSPSEFSESEVKENAEV